MYVRPARWNRLGCVVSGARFGMLAIGASVGLAAGEARAVTQLTINTFSVTQASGAALPASVPKSSSAGLLPGNQSATLIAGFGPFPRQAWQSSQVSTVRVAMSGSILGGVEAGDDLAFVYSMVITASAGTITWNVRGNASVPPGVGFFDGRSGSVLGNGEPQGIFGGVFFLGSQSNGVWSTYIDFTWSGATIIDTLTVSVPELTVHLPTSGSLALFGIAGLVIARRRR